MFLRQYDVSRLRHKEGGEVGWMVATTTLEETEQFGYHLERTKSPAC